MLPVLRKVAWGLAQSLFAIALGLAASALLIGVFGYDVPSTFYWLFYGGFVREGAIFDALAFATPLMLTGCAFAVAALAGLFNIGTEGQAYMGAIGAILAGALLAESFSPLRPIALPLSLVFSAVFGLLWAVVPAVLKAYFGVHEVISTIMFNWMAFWVSMYLVQRGPLVDPNRPEKSLSVVPEARFGVIESILTTSIYFAVAVVVAVYFILWYTKVGFELRVVGSNPHAAVFAGISVKKRQVLALVISGALAGLAGGLIVVGRPPKWAIHGTLGDVMNVGFDGIGVSMIALNHPLGILLSSLFIGGIRNGSRLLEPYAKMSSELSRAVIGLMIIAMALPGIVGYIKSYLRVATKRGVESA
ncbi:MAG: ABC transporter permease [Desulfurococcaceae archaeon]|jgi:simple sugar transport system permease protein